MDKQPRLCSQCGKKKISKIRHCPYRTEQTCPYKIIHPFNVPISFIGRSWLDYLDIGINIIIFVILYQITKRALILIFQSQLFSIPPTVKFFVFILGIAIAGYLFMGLMDKSIIIKMPPPLKGLQKQLIHYYNPISQKGFIAYQRFGISLQYGETAVQHISILEEKKHLSKYPPSLLATLDLSAIDDLYEMIITQRKLIPKAIRWTLLSLAAQDMIQLKHLKLTRSTLNGEPFRKTLCFVVPKPRLTTLQEKDSLQKKIKTQLLQQINMNIDAAHWSGKELYQLVYHFYEKTISNPQGRLIEWIVEDAEAMDLAKYTIEEGFKAKLKNLFLKPWHLLPMHESAILVEKEAMADWDNAFLQRYPAFTAKITQSVQKALEDRTRKNTSD